MSYTLDRAEQLLGGLENMWLNWLCSIQCEVFSDTIFLGEVGLLWINTLNNLSKGGPFRFERKVLTTVVIFALLPTKSEKCVPCLHPEQKYLEGLRLKACVRTRAGLSWNSGAAQSAGITKKKWLHSGNVEVCCPLLCSQIFSCAFESTIKVIAQWFRSPSPPGPDYTGFLPT